MRSYGACRVPAEDCDILLDPSEQKVFRECLKKQFQNEAKSLGFEIDLMRAETPLFSQALLQSRAATWKGKRIKIVTPDYLCAMKVKAFDERRDARKRDTDRRDILGLLKMGANADEVSRILNQTAPEPLPVLKKPLSAAPKRPG